MDRDKWNEMVKHPLQSWEWGEFRGQRQPISRTNGMLVVWTKIKFTPWYFGYIPMGKMPSDKEIKMLRDLGKEKRAVGIRMEPNVMKNEQCKISNELRPGRPLFKPNTFVWDLKKSEEELLKNMHPKGRYNIRVALKHGVKVRISQRAEDFEKYLELMFSGTTKRQKIYSHSESYHHLLWESLKDGMARLFVAEYQGEIIAANMIFQFKNGIYYAYGASALEHKEVMASTLMLWEIARWGKSQGCLFFDLWGAEEGKGFSRFKEQFGAELTEFVGTYDLPVNPLLYKLFRLAEEARWKMLRILK
jgi:lipid II:glycine glycyltransferase (peptidoglycan interpeptide bridge formation enzyme)